MNRTGYGKVDGDLFNLVRVGDWVGLTYQGIKTPRNPGKKPYSGFRTAHVPLPSDAVAQELERRESSPEPDATVEADEDNGSPPMASDG